MIEVLSCDAGGVIALEPRSLTEPPSHPCSWINLTSPTEQELQTVQSIFKLHSLAMEDVIHKGQRPKLEDYDDHLFTVLHALKRRKEEVSAEEIFVFMGNRWLITIHDGNHQVEEVLNRAMKVGGSHIQMQGPVFLYHILVDKVIDSYFVVLDEVEDRTDRLEERVEEEPTKKVLREMDDLRKNLTSIRRSLWPTREMVGNIMKGILPLVSDQNLPYFRNIYDHLAQLIDLVEVCHNRVNSIGELYLSSISASTNEVVKFFTVLATLFLPPTLIASIYGMNFAAMPELGWSSGYPFALALMFLSSFIPWVYLKKKRLI